MKNFFYAVWADAINYERIKNGGESHWKLFTFAYMSVFLGLNILAIWTAIRFFSGYNLADNLMKQLGTITNNEKLQNLLLSMIVMFMPGCIINYFLVFYRKKYEYILKKYEFKNGKLLIIYVSLTIISVFGFSLLNKYIR